MKIDVAVVSHGTEGFLLDLLASLRADLPAERIGAVHVWDNASSDRSLAVLDRFATLVPWLRVHRSERNVLHGPALDALLRRHATAEWVLVLDADCVLLGDPCPALEPLLGGRPAFVGQVHPEPDHLYCYLCHLVVHRETALALPPFSGDGAPGTAFFRAAAARSLPWARLRWVDLVRHHGQASLRGVARRGDRWNPLFRFAAAEARRAPSTAARLTLEATLAARVDAFLAGADPAPAGALPGAPDLSSSPPPRREETRPALATRRRLAARLTPLPLVRRVLGMGVEGDQTSLVALLALLRRRAPLRVLDTGVRWGGSLLLLAASADRHAHVVGVEEPPWEVDDPGEAEKRVRLASLLLGSQRLDLVRRAPGTSGADEEVARALAGERADVLLLHGDTDAGVALRSLARHLAPAALVAGPLSAPRFRQLWERAAPAGRLLLGEAGSGGWGAFVA